MLKKECPAVIYYASMRNSAVTKYVESRLHTLDWRDAGIGGRGKAL